jgi:putative acetyltransferase
VAIYYRATVDSGADAFSAWPNLRSRRAPSPAQALTHHESAVARTPFLIHQDDLQSEPTRELLRLHLAGMHAHSPPGSVFALDVSGLKAPGVTVWSAWAGDSIAGIGALRELGGGTGEVKSMRTHPAFLRQGVGALLLEHIIATARARRMTRLSLETGSGAAFAPALSLYRQRGFVDGEPFADYVRSPFNHFLHLTL